MKKRICILLALAMLLSLAACGAPAAPAPAAEEAAPANDAAPAEEAAPAEDAAPAEEGVEAEAAIGQKDGSSYVNRAFGIRVLFPDSWMILDEEQTAEIMGIAADMSTDEDQAKLLRETGSLCDLYAVARDQNGDSLNIMVEDLGSLYGLMLNEESYSQIAVLQLENALGQMGMTNVVSETGSYPFAGQERVSMLFTAEYNGVPVVERVILLKAGNYMAAVTAFSLDAGRADEILGCFEAIDG